VTEKNYGYDNIEHTCVTGLEISTSIFSDFLIILCLQNISTYAVLNNDASP